MRAAFTLMELLAVMAIIAIAMSMVLVVNRRQRDSTLVRQTAEELAAVLRRTRNQAIEQKAYFGVSFNLANGKGTSGRVPNNHDGGHWYRVLGPDLDPQSVMYGAGGQNGSVNLPQPKRFWAQGHGNEYSAKNYLEYIARFWDSPRYVLPPRSVRFLALTDQDNGARCRSVDQFQATYPRPWFGTWDAATGRWYAWGGYDTTIKDSSPWWPRPTLSSSAFYYEGFDGTITGSVNPADRLVWRSKDGNGDMNYSSSSDAVRDWPMLHAGQVRPVINGDWMDAMIVFRPDGNADFRWFSMRREYALRCYDGGRPFGLGNPRGPECDMDKLGNGDMSNLAGNWGDWGNSRPIERNVTEEASQYAERSGFFYITLARDATDDQDTFSTPEELINSLMPAIRVGVSRTGEVRLSPVRRALAAGDVLEPTAQGAWWNQASIGTAEFRRNILTITGQERPVDDALTPDMVRHRQWWLQ